MMNGQMVVEGGRGSQLAKEVCLLTISLFTLHVQTTRLKLKDTAAKFCSANSKAIQQANPTQILLFMLVAKCTRTYSSV